MTAKERLHQEIEDMSQEEAEFFLDWLGPDNEDELPPLTQEDLAALDQALEQERRGQVVPHEEVPRRFGRS